MWLTAGLFNAFAAEDVTVFAGLKTVLSAPNDCRRIISTSFGGIIRICR
jgi:hypothetical protein